MNIASFTRIIIQSSLNVCMMKLVEKIQLENPFQTVFDFIQVDEYRIMCNAHACRLRW